MSRLNKRGPAPARALTLALALELLGSALAASAGCSGDNAKPPVVMEALARAAYAMTLAEGYSGSHLVALAKMSDLERAARAGEALREHDHGRVQLGQQWFEWDSLAPPVEEPSRAQSLALTVTWNHGQKHFERHLETLVTVPKPETKAP